MMQIVIDYMQHSSLSQKEALGGFHRGGNDCDHLLIIYFLHPPHPISFNENTQWATGVVIIFLCQRRLDTTPYSDYLLDLLNILLYLLVEFVKVQVEFVKDSRDSLHGHLAMFPMNSRYPRPCTYLLSTFVFSNMKLHQKMRPVSEADRYI